MIGTPQPGTLPWAILEALVAYPGDYSNSTLARFLNRNGQDVGPEQVARLFSRLREAGYLLPRRFYLQTEARGWGSPRQRQIVALVAERGPLTLKELVSNLEAHCVQGSLKAELRQLHELGVLSPPSCPWPSREALELLAPGPDTAERKVLERVYAAREPVHESELAAPLSLGRSAAAILIDRLRRSGWLRTSLGPSYLVSPAPVIGALGFSFREVDRG